MTALPDGRLAVAGSAHGATIGTWAEVARLRSDGSLDPTFGSDGRKVFRFQNIALARFADAVLVDPDGARVVVVGPFGNDDRVGLARFLENGEVDPSFGDEDTPGRVAAHLKGPTDVRIRDAAIVGSRYRDPFGDDFYSARVSSRWTFEDGFETGSWSLWSNGG